MIPTWQTEVVADKERSQFLRFWGENDDGPFDVLVVYSKDEQGNILDYNGCIQHNRRNV